jgi:hypothetical protein
MATTADLFHRKLFVVAYTKRRPSALEHPLSGRRADLNPEIGLGLRRREPSMDFRAAAGII